MRYALLFLLLPALCLAELVELTDLSGRRLEAELVKVDMGYLTFKKINGKRFTLPLSKLSEASQKLVYHYFHGGSVEQESSNAEERLESSAGLNPLKVDFHFNSEPPAMVTVNTFNSKTRKRDSRSVSATSHEIDISTLEDGDYTITFEAEGYAHQWYRGNIRKGRFSPRSFEVDFRRKRYVIIKYAINLDAKPLFHDEADLYSGVAAFSDLKYGNPQHFLGWRIRQAELGEKRFSDDFILQWKWMVPESGLCVREERFDAIQTAEGDRFRLSQIELKKGVVFTCKSSFSRNPGLYGKFEVLDVVDEPADDIEVY